MFSLFGSTYSVLYPWLMAIGLPLIVCFLIYIYKQHGQGKKIVVSSILIFQAIEHKTQARQKFVPPFRLFFELLILLLLLLAGSGLYRTESSEKVAFVIDNSFSMGAVNNGITRLETVKKQAFSYTFDGQTDLYITSPVLKKLNNIGELEDVEVVFAEDKLESILTKIVNEGYSDITVFTDKKKFTTSLPINFVEMSNGNKNNVAISAIDTESDNLVVRVNSYAHGVFKGVLKAEFTMSNGLNETVKQTVSLTQQAKESFFFRLPAFANTVSVSLLPDGKSKNLDAILADNHAYFSFFKPKSSVLLVSDFSPNDLGLDKLPNFDFQYLKTAEYRADHPMVLEASFIIFHRFSPELWPPKSALMIMPDSYLAQEEQETVLTNWDNSNQLLKYVSIPNIPEFKIKPIKNTLGLSEVMHTTVGSVLSCGEFNQKRYVVSAFEMLPYEGKESPVMSIFTLNVFDWLSADGITQGYQTVYTYFKPQNSSQEKSQRKILNKITYHDGKVIAGNVLLYPGLVKGESGWLAVNYFNGKESNLYSRQRINFSQFISKKTQEKSLFAQLFVYIVLILLVIDTILFCKSQR